MPRIRRTLLTLSLVSAVALAQAQLDNAAIIKMSKAGLGDDLLIQTIRTQPGHYATSAADLVALKQAGVSDPVIGAMLSNSGSLSATPPAAVASTPEPTAGVDEVGLYYKDRSGNWVAMNPEIVNFKSGGFLKSMATNGIVKQDMNGHLAGQSAKLQLTGPVQLLIYAPEGTAPNEYQMLHLRQGKDTREFRSSTGGVFHTSTGATRDVVPIDPARISPRHYTVTLDPSTPAGEYGILPPGSVSTANAASGGKIYTFHLVE